MENPPTHIVVICCLVATGMMAPAVTAHDGQIASYLEDEDRLSQNIDVYNTAVSENAEQVPSALRNRLAGETVNMEVIGDKTYTYSAELDEQLQATNFRAEHSEQATVLVRTELATLQSIKHAGNPTDEAKQAYVVDDISVESTEQTSTTERTVLGAAELTKTVASDEKELVEFPGKETAVSIVDKTASSASDLGSRVVSGLGF